MKDSSTTSRKALKLVPVPSSPNINDAWRPKTNAQRMSKSRFRLRAKMWRKRWVKWMKEHPFTWIMPLILNLLAAVCALTCGLEGILLALLFVLLGEIFLFIYLFKVTLFCFRDQFHNDTKMRLRDLGIPPRPYLFFAVVGGVCIGLGSDCGVSVLWTGIILIIITLFAIPLMMYFMEGTPGSNSYGPAPDDAPTEEELGNKDA